MWINAGWYEEFIEKLTDIFGYGIFDDGNFNANIQPDAVCIDLNDILGGCVDIERVFPKYRYRH